MAGVRPLATAKPLVLQVFFVSRSGLYIRIYNNIYIYTCVCLCAVNIKIYTFCHLSHADLFFRHGRPFLGSSPLRFAHQMLLGFLPECGGAQGAKSRVKNHQPQFHGRHFISWAIK